MFDIVKLRFWCHKVMPLVYDDSLSYYEVICKVAKKLNEVIETVDKLPDYIAELISDERLREIMQTILNNLEEQIASANEGESETATADRVVGELVWLNGDLYRVVKVMDAGDRYVAGSNVEKVTVEELINECKLAITDTVETNERNASENRNKGDLIWLNNKLALITANIAEGNGYNSSNYREVTVEYLLGVLSGNLETEIQNREDADTALSGRINDEVTARGNADTALGGRIDDEIIARKNADNVLDGKITQLKNSSIVVNVTEHDVSNLGVDCTSALQDVIDANPNKVIYFPTGTYLVTGSVTISNPVTLLFDDDAVLDGGTTYDVNTFEVESDNVSVIGGTFKNGSLSSFNNRTLNGSLYYTNIFRFYHVKNCYVRNVKVAYNTCGGTFSFFSCRNVIVENSVFEKFLLGAVVFMNDCQNVKVENCMFSHAHVSNDENVWYCYPIASGYSDYTIEVSMIDGFIVNNCTFYDCEWEACDCHGGKNIRFTNLKIHNANRAIICYPDNRPTLTDYDFENCYIGNCYIYNDDDYEYQSRDTTIYLGGTFELKFKNVTVENVKIINPVCYDASNVDYGAIYCSYTDNITLKGISIEATKGYSRNPYILYVLNVNNIKVENFNVKGFPRKTGSGPLYFSHCVGRIDGVHIESNGNNYCGIQFGNICALDIGLVSGTIDNYFYADRNTYLMPYGRFIPKSFPRMLISSKFGNFLSGKKRGFGSTKALTDTQITFTVSCTEGNKYVLGDAFAGGVVGASVSISDGTTTLETLVTGFGRDRTYIADALTFSGTATMTINRLGWEDLGDPT